ncbi:MAG: transcriptional regulator [Microbacterium sp.]|nr:transcriptional regulator [Microbacterium sp.]
MTTAQMLDDRYGRRSARRGTRFWTIVAAVGVSAAVAVAAWFAFSASATTAEASTTGFELVDEASDDHSQAFRESIPVTAAATTGFVNNCWVS